MNRLIAIFCGVLVAALGKPAFAQSLPFNTSEASTVAAGLGSSIENHSTRTGEMHFEFPIIGYAGKLPLYVSISVNKGEGLRDAAGVLEIPRLQIPAAGPSGPQNTPINSNSCDNAKTYYVKPVLQLAGSTRVFVTADPATSPFPDADFISHDGWVIKCIRTHNTLTYWTPNADYLMRAPNGLTYRFYVLNKVASLTGNEVPVHSVVDTRGNRIDYDYMPATAPSGLAFLPSAIRRSDGKSIRFGYTTFPPVGTFQVIPPPTLATITADNGKTWRIEYKECADIDQRPIKPLPCPNPQNTSGRKGILSRIIAPDGNATSLEYTVYASRVHLGADATLGRRSHVTAITYANGLVARYEYREMSLVLTDGSSLIKLDAAPGTESGIGFVNFNNIAALVRRTYTGPGIPTPITYMYDYFTPNFEQTDTGVVAGKHGGNFSVTFERGPTKMTVSKFRRNILGLEDTSSALPFDVARLIEIGVVPLPGSVASSPPVLSLPATVPAPCLSSAGCNDNNVCTTDSCANGACVNTPIACSDGNACTTDSCSPQTGCRNTPISCDDGTNCSTDSCNPGTGCVYVALSCNDGNACTTDSCNSATGCMNTARSCNDGNACTTDSCNPQTGCSNASVSCNDGNACTADSCNPGSGCVNTYSTTLCPCISTGNPCGNRCSGTATDNCGTVFTCNASCGFGVGGLCPCQGGFCSSAGTCVCRTGGECF